LYLLLTNRGAERDGLLSLLGVGRLAPSLFLGKVSLVSNGEKEISLSSSRSRPVLSV